MPVANPHCPGARSSQDHWLAPRCRRAEQATRHFGGELESGTGSWIGSHSMLLTSSQHMRLARTHHRAAAEARLSLPEKRELQYNARRHETLAKQARKLERQKPGE
jgi:hypothetical protein